MNFVRLITFCEMGSKYAHNEMKFYLFCFVFHQAVSFFRFFAIFSEKTLALSSDFPIMRTTQRRTVVNELSYAVRRSFLLFNNVSDNLCGHLLMIDF
ncbi:hypothetical protein, partial [Ursidibacter sp. B-7004-1]